MSGLRNKPLKRFGASLAGVALCLQLALASWGLFAQALLPGQPEAFGPHALCLAGGGVPPPADSPATPAHEHPAYCCLWHSLPAVAPQAALLPQPVAYAAVGHDQGGNAAVTPGPRHGPANARAPPTLT